jgi:UDP-N-acetylmuramoylalanine--D-glutamate ligase
MIKLDFAKNKTYYLVGMGKSNREALAALKKSGADVLIWDDNPDNIADYAPDIVRAPDKAPWSKIKALVTAPSMKPDHPIIQQAMDKNIPVICDIDLFAQSEPSSRIIGITGTNGKSTTTALIHHILNADDKAQMGGNIGTPVLSLKNRMQYTVLELSSYQLDRAPHLKCDVAILLNITPDHLDWHGNMDHYAASKAKVFNNAKIKIISVEDDYSKEILNNNLGAIPLDTDSDLPFDPNDFPKMKGRHNIQNILAAYEACRALGMDHDDIIARIKDFDGLPHRQHVVRLINGIAYVNDSKATNAESAKQALRAYKNIFWICGGQPKDGGLESLGQELRHVSKAYIFGEARAEFEKFLNASGVDVISGEKLEDVFMQAHKDAQDARGTPAGSPCVLFSPACASFDQYPNFEVRGDHFTDLVIGLQDA